MIRTEYPEIKSDIVWEEGGLQFSIFNNVEVNFYCGYVRFPSRPLVEQGFRGFANYINAHGGITYAQESDDKSMVYGFDCGHYGDTDDPVLKDIEHLQKLCREMALGIKVAVEFEKDYLVADNDAAKAEIIQNYHNKLKDEHDVVFKVGNNFGTMINLLCGRF